jgi:AcrR family transcriptional regulator
MTMPSSKISDRHTPRSETSPIDSASIRPVAPNGELDPHARTIRRRVQSVITRDLIVRVAEELIFSLGLARITTRKIATTAGVSEATLFRYFPTKDELILAALQRRSFSRAEILDAVMPLTGSIEHNIARVARVALDYYDRIMGTVFAAMADTSLLPRHREWLLGETLLADLAGLVSDYIERERSLGHVRAAASSTMVAELLLGAVLRHVVGRMFKGDAVSSPSDERFVRELARGVTPMIASENCFCEH